MFCLFSTATKLNTDFQDSKSLYINEDTRYRGGNGFSLRVWREETPAHFTAFESVKYLVVLTERGLISEAQ